MSRKLLVLTLVCAGSLAAAAAGAAEWRGDVRDLSVGANVAELPSAGYVEFACLGADWTAGAAIDGWSDFRSCPAGPDGTRTVTFRYDDAVQEWARVNDDWEGTKIAGHPVLLAIAVAEDGTIEAIRARTDPKARMYMKKKAFLLGLRVMGRYGREGWSCTEAAPAADHAPVGGMYIDRHCEKEVDGRVVAFDTKLYRAPGQEGQAFTGATELEIRKLRS
jgi:hypothetical protein